MAKSIKTLNSSLGSKNVIDQVRVDFYNIECEHAGKHHHLKHAFMFPRTSVKVGNLSRATRATAKHQQDNA